MKEKYLKYNDYYIYDKYISDYITRSGSKYMNDVYKYIKDYGIDFSETEEEKLEKERQNKRDLRQKKIDRIFK